MTATASATRTATATATPTPTPTPTPVPENLKIKPSPQNFGKVKVGRSKNATLTLVNPARKGAPITFGNPMMTFEPAGADEFKSVGTTCGAQLLPRKKCKLTLQFGPDSIGPKSTTLTIFDNAGNANQVVPLSGKGE